MPEFTSENRKAKMREPGKASGLTSRDNFFVFKGRFDSGARKSGSKPLNFDSGVETLLPTVLAALWHLDRLQVRGGA